MSDEDALAKLREQAKTDLDLIKRAEAAIAQIDRGQPFSDEHADVLAALRIRIEGRPRAKLEDLLSAAGDLSGGKDLGEAIGGAEEGGSKDWPEITDKKRDWPGV